jgi:hypothetical protein
MEEALHITPWRQWTQRDDWSTFVVTGANLPKRQPFVWRAQTHVAW